MSYEAELELRIRRTSQMLLALANHPLPWKIEPTDNGYLLRAADLAPIFEHSEMDGAKMVLELAHCIQAGLDYDILLARGVMSA